MLSASEIRKKITELISEEGVALYDMDMPSPKNGVLRIYLSQLDGKCQGIDVDLCEKVSRKITAASDFAWLTEQYALEVSSPGINRRLNRAEHFENAVGERVKLKVSEFGKRDETLLGVISRCENGVLDLVIEGLEESRTINLVDIRKANVDFLFK